VKKISGAIQTSGQVTSVENIQQLDEMADEVQRTTPRWMVHTRPIKTMQKKCFHLTNLSFSNAGSYKIASLRAWGLFLESPDNFSGPESYFMCSMFTLKTW